MPIIYLSPSTQEANMYVNGGSEEEWMNRLADAMVPYLNASGIQYTRNTPDMTAVSSIRASNAGTYDLHLALHSNASAPSNYPLPNRVRAEATTSIGEVRQPRAPSVFIELGYHDNEDDATWIKNNLDQIARTIVLALTEYFGIPFLGPTASRQGVVDVDWGYLNIRSRPTTSAPVIARAYDGARLTILNQWQGWYLVSFDGAEGYANSDFITLL